MTSFDFLTSSLFFQDPHDQNVRWQKGKVIRESDGEGEAEVRYLLTFGIDRDQLEVMSGRIEPRAIPGLPLLNRWF